MQQGRGGIGSRKHGVSGRAPQSPRFRLMNRLAAERGDFGGGATRRRQAPMFGSLRELFNRGRKPQ